MSCGRPVVASRISGFQLLMEHGRQGLMVSPADDANRFAQALLYLLDRPAERARMGREGRLTAVARYAWSSVAAQLEQLYDELLDPQAGLAVRKRAVIRRFVGASALAIAAGAARRASWSARRSRAGPAGRLRPRLHARPDLGLGVVHAELAALRPGRDGPRHERSRARADVRRRPLLRDGRRPCSTRCATAARARPSSCSAATSRRTPSSCARMQRRGPRDRLARLRPRAADVRLAGRRRAAARAHRALARRRARRAAARAALPRAARLPQPVRRARDRAPRLRVVGWTKGVWDTASPGVEAIVRRTIGGFRPGGILLLHDADGCGEGGDRSQTAEAVPEIVERAHAAGYELVTVSELAERAPARRTAPGASSPGSCSRRRARARAALGGHQRGQRVDMAWWWVIAALGRTSPRSCSRRSSGRRRWTRSRDHPRVQYVQVVPALFVGFLLNTLLLARLGEIGRVAVLRRRLKLAAPMCRTPRWPARSWPSRSCSRSRWSRSCCCSCRS